MLTGQTWRPIAPRPRRSLQAWRTVTIGPRSIAVLHEQYAASSRLELETAWARVSLRKQPLHWYPPALWLKSRQTEVELGAFLNSSEKNELAEALSRTIGVYSAWQHQKIEGN